MSDTPAPTPAAGAQPRPMPPPKSALKATAKTAAADAEAAEAAASAARIRTAAEVKAAQLQSTVKAQQQWQEWISRVQMKLLEPLVDASTMHRAALVLRPSEYEEVIEERVSGRRCAHPPCDQPIGTDAAARAKKYHLSLSAQRVYDVTQAQQYCSETCFMASEVYKSGLQDEPFYLRQMKQQATTKPTAKAAPPTAASIREESKQSADDMPQKEADAGSASSTTAGSITQLVIVEKENVGRQAPPKPKAVAADALAVEGYKPKYPPTLLPKKSPTTEPPPAPSALPTPKVESNPAASASGQQPLSAAPSSQPIEVSTSSAAAPSVSSAPPNYLEFAQLPRALAERVAMTSSDDRVTPLSRAEFAALGPDEQIDYLGLMALQEKNQLQQAAQAAAPANTSLPPPAASETAVDPDEKKIRRRKPAGDKQTPAPTTESADSAATATAASSTGASAAAAPPASSSPAGAPGVAARSSPSSSSRVPSSAAVLCDDDSEPIISAAEIKSNLAAARSVPLSPFLGLLQAIMRWTTVHTGHFIRTGLLPSPTPGSANRQRQSAFLTMVQQQWTQLAPLVGLQRVCPRELREITESLSFDDPIPPMKANQWRMITLTLMHACVHRLAIEDGHMKAPPTGKPTGAAGDTSANRPASASSLPTCLQPYSSCPTPIALATAVEHTIRQSGFTPDQLQSIYDQWMMQTAQSYL